MHPDIENFSQALDIDTNQCLKAHLKIATHSDAVYSLHVNSVPTADLESEWTFDLFDTIILECKVEQGAVEILNFSINDIEVLPKYQHFSNSATVWIEKEWDMEIPSPFYVWHHSISGQGWVA